MTNILQRIHAEAHTDTKWQKQKDRLKPTYEKHIDIYSNTYINTKAHIYTQVSGKDTYIQINLNNKRDKHTNTNTHSHTKKRNNQRKQHKTKDREYQRGENMHAPKHTLQQKHMHTQTNLYIQPHKKRHKEK